MRSIVDNGSIHDKVDDIISSLSKDLDSISNIKGQLYANIVFYIIIIGVMIFFTSIVLMELYNVLNNYNMMNKDSNRDSNRNNPSRNFNIDSNIYDDSNSFINQNINHNEYIINKLEKQNINVKAHFKELLKFKQKHDIDSKLHTSITPDNISSVNDNYNYQKKKNTPFWDLLFTPPKHYELMNKIGNHSSFN